MDSIKIRYEKEGKDKKDIDYINKINYCLV